MTQPQTYKKKLIEVAIPLEAINAASAREKSIRHGHPSTLHLWWARRPLAACRAVLFAQLVDDPSSHPEQFPTHEDQEKERRRLFAIIEDLVKWENSTNEEVLEKARAEIRRSCGGVLPPVYDPFSGGGSIPLEAQRLGLPAYGSDLNPVAVMIGKAMIEIPPKFKDMPPIHPGIKERSFYRNAEGLAEDVKYYGEWMRQKAWERIGHLYPQADLPKEYGGGKGTVVAWIWARTVPSPNPAFADVDVPLVRSFQLSDEAWVEPIVDGKKYTFQVRIGALPDAEKLEGTVSRQGGRCIVSNSAMPLNYIRDMARKNGLGQRLMAVVVEGTRGRLFLPPTDGMERTAFTSQPNWRPEEIVTTPSHEVDRLPMYGMTTWGAAFTDRQATALTTFVDIAKDLKAKIQEDLAVYGESPPVDPIEYTNAIRVYLACAIDRCADA
jgi:putative DNA methylase